MKKPLFAIIIISFLATACQTKPSFDLADLVLGEEKINTVLPEDAESKIFKLGENTGLEYVMVRSKQLMNFNGKQLSGTLNPDSGQGKNGISFYYNTKDSLIYKYNITIFTIGEGENLLEALKEKLGAPDFTSYRTAADKAEDRFRGLLWEDQNNNRLYRLNYGQDGTVKATLDVTENTLDIEALNLIPPFGFWEDYLNARKMKNNMNYTYQQFIADETKEDPENSYLLLSK